MYTDSDAPHKNSINADTVSVKSSLEISLDISIPNCLNQFLGLTKNTLEKNLLTKHALIEFIGSDCVRGSILGKVFETISFSFVFRHLKEPITFQHKKVNYRNID